MKTLDLSLLKKKFSTSYNFDYNVKIIEYVVPTTGTYTIRVSMKDGYEKPSSGTVYQEYAVAYGYK